MVEYQDVIFGTDISKWFFLFIDWWCSRNII